MSRYPLLALAVLMLILSASDVWALEVTEVAMTTAVVNREPVDIVDVFPMQNEKLYCFTRIVGAEEPTVIYHVWYRDGQVMYRVELPVNSPDWRTWSAKRFDGDLPGEWKVEILAADGTVLQQTLFHLS